MLSSASSGSAACHRYYRSIRTPCRRGRAALRSLSPAVVVRHQFRIGRLRIVSPPVLPSRSVVRRSSVNAFPTAPAAAVRPYVVSATPPVSTSPRLVSCPQFPSFSLRTPTVESHGCRNRSHIPPGEALTSVIDTCAERPPSDSVLESDPVR